MSQATSPAGYCAFWSPASNSVLLFNTKKVWKG